MMKENEIEFHDIASVFPMMKEKDLANLASDIKKNGLQNKIILYENKILDGRNRYKACLMAGVTPKLEEYKGDNPVEYNISVNLQRRHLTKSMKAVSASRKANMSHGGDRPSKKDSNFDCAQMPFATSKAEAAERFDVSERMIGIVRTIERDAPELISKIEYEDMTVTAAAKEIKQRKKRQADAEAVKATEIQPIIHKIDCFMFNPGKVDLLLTDPPYSTDVDDISLFAPKVIDLLKYVKPTGRAYIFIGSYPDELTAYLNSPPPAHMKLSQVLVWAYRNTLGPSPKHLYKNNWQAILYFTGNESQSLDCPVLNELFSVQDINAPDGRLGDRFHSWQKPTEISDRFIRHATKSGDIVYDPFACTGTFLISASLLGRKGIGCEISQANIDIAKSRGVNCE
jgi:hypothetical protein